MLSISLAYILKISTSLSHFTKISTNFRLKSRESQKYIDLGLEEKKELSAFIYTELHSPKLTENESHETLMRSGE